MSEKQEKKAEKQEEAPEGSGAGLSIEQYFAKEDAKPGTFKNPISLNVTAGDLASNYISMVDACVLMNKLARQKVWDEKNEEEQYTPMLFNPKGLARECGKSAPPAYIAGPGNIVFLKAQCAEFAKAVVARRENEARMKAEMKQFNEDQKEFEAAMAQGLDDVA